MLSFETSNSDLKQRLCIQTVNWDAIVVVASKHLVLPAVYCRLQQRSLLECLPDDLYAYLKELTALNRIRNQTLMEEARVISKLFTKNDINFVFIKGIAIMAGNYYNDYGERMIGDIDILVSSEHLERAFELLTSEGYTKTIEFNYDVKNYRHLPRQISPTCLGAIELHGQLLKNGYNHLIDTDVFLSDKIRVNGIPIPNSRHLIINAILARQINDRASYFVNLNLKVIYDVLVLKLNEDAKILQQVSNEKHSLQFLRLSSVFFSEIIPSKETFSNNLKIWYFLWLLQYPKLNYLQFKLKQLLMDVKERLHLILFNKSYRNHLIKNKILKQE